MPKVSVTANSLSPDLRESIRIARSLRFQGVLLDAMIAGEDLSTLSQSAKREVAHIVSSNDLELVGLRATIDRTGLNRSADIDQQIDRIDRAMQGAKGLQAPLVCVDLRQLPQVAAPPKPTRKISSDLAGLILLPPSANTEEEAAPAPKIDSAALSHVNAVLVEIGALADRHGVRIAFSAGLSSFASLAWAIQTARCQWFGIDLNPVDALTDDWSADEIFSTFADHLFHVQVKDALTGNDRRTQPALPGRGDVKWDDLFQHLRDSDYQGWLTVDPTEHTDRIAAAKMGLTLCSPPLW